MLRCLIIDDEPPAIKLLQNYVERHELLTLAAAYSNPIEALQQIDQHAIDFILLDIQMPELSGVQFAKIVKGKYPVILTTAYETYALAGYELHVVDYLLKPISYERFSAAIDKVPNADAAADTTSSTQARDYIFVKNGYLTQRIDLNQILWLEGLSDYVRIQTSSGPILTLDTLKNFATTLPTDRFIRVHRSYLVAIDKIDYIERNRIVIGEQRIPIGGTYQEAFWQRIGNE